MSERSLFGSRSNVKDSSPAPSPHGSPAPGRRDGSPVPGSPGAPGTPTGSPLINSIKRHNMSDFKKLAEKADAIEQVDEQGRTAIMLAAAEGQEDMVKALLKAHGVRLNLAQVPSVSPLSPAEHVGQVDVLGNTALHYGAASGVKSIVEMLLKAGASPKALNSRGETALHAVCALPRWKRGEEKVLKLLLEDTQTAAVLNHVTGAEGLTAIQLACKNRLLDAVSLLLKHKADPSIADG